MMRCALRLAAFAMLGAATLPAGAQEAQTADAPPGADAVPAAAAPLYDYYRIQAAEYELAIDSQGQSAGLAFDPRSLVNWSMEGNWFGSLFVWTAEGRPVVLGCVGSGPEEGEQIVFHEFHLLDDVTLRPVPIRGAREWTWTPRSDDLAARLASEEEVAAEPAARLRQMRELARSCAVEMLEGDEHWELRLLPQPIYRFAGHEAAAADGALFAYLWTKGTDPEFVLLLETLATDAGLRWHYRPLRFTWRALALTRVGETVWEVPVHDESWRATELVAPYVTAPIVRRSLGEIRQAVAEAASP
jgi:hypothetical protein